MASEDWYQNTRWNKRIEDTFFDKLARSRSQRDQYLVIQALTLASHVPEKALELVDHYFETRKDDFHDVLALLAKADAFRTMKNVPETIRAYKDVLAREAEFPSHRTRAYLDLPYFIACEGVSGEYEFGLATLERGLDSVTFPVDIFIWYASQALIVSDQGRNDNAAKFAREALEVAQVKKSGFRYHQNIGLVGKEHQKVIKKLANIVG